MATLSNIGNSCYLNSVLYTLRFAPYFLHKLHHLLENVTQISQKMQSQNRGGVGSVAAGAKSASLGRNVSGLQGPSTRSRSTKDLASMGTFVGSGGAAGQLNANAARGDNATAVTATTTTSPPPTRTSRQIVTEKLHELYNRLRLTEVSESADSFHADNFLNSVQEVNAIFEGNQQQDAHEFLMCLLDSIRETCQTLAKVIGDYPDIFMNG